ncbi:hypothetical protein HPP92_028701, partial [Vanilla planifolia]
AKAVGAPLFLSARVPNNTGCSIRLNVNTTTVAAESGNLRGEQTKAVAEACPKKAER